MLEVRCCCQPTKLLGWLPTDCALVGHRVAFRLTGPWKEQQTTHTYVHLEVAEFRNGHASWPAFKAEGMPIETLRRLPGFKEK